MPPKALDHGRGGKIMIGFSTPAAHNQLIGIVIPDDVVVDHALGHRGR